MYKRYYPSVVLLFILALCLVIYWAGLRGGFLFDDYPNLQDLGTYGEIDSWDKVQAFITNGFAGPTGRPISLASFLIDANTWPTLPFSFKYTNLMIHLLNGVLLCWASLLLLRNYHYKEQQAIWVSLVATAIWMLHPYFVSTTLYIVQRMAQLATLFSLIGIIGYLKARLIIEHKPIIAYFWMVFAIGTCTMLATFSKENGALLPLLILIIEFCNPNKENKPIWQWRAVCLWLPSCVLIYLIFRELNFADHLWPNRNFNQVERLYSEARIVTEYLYNLIIPQIELKGLYQDGYMISKSILQPITTLYSILFLSTLALTAFIFKNKYPLFSLAVLFFFAAHLMESTVLGLELYFEHRNYLAALFLFLPIANAIYMLHKKIDTKLVCLIVSVLLMILSFFSYERAKLWGDVDQLQLYWAKNSPNSPRAQNAIAAVLMDQGRVVEANQFLEKTIERIPDSALLNLRLLLQKIYVNIAVEQDFKETAQRLEVQAFDAQAIQALRTLIEHITDNHKADQYGDLSLLLIKSLEKNPQYNDFPIFKKLMPYLKAKIYLAQNKPNLALAQYLIAMLHYKDVEAGMMMVAEVGSSKHYNQALIILNSVEEIYRKQDPRTLKRSKKEYDYEISRLKTYIYNEIQQKGNK